MSRSLLVAALFLGFAGCRSVPLRADPTAHEPSSAPPLSIFSVDWFTPLVKPELLEYIPREPASPAVDPDTHRVVVTTRDGYVRCLDPDGKVEWTYKTFGGFLAAAGIKDGNVYVPGGDGNLYALSMAGGRLLWKYVAGEELATQPVIAAGKVLVASESNTLYVVEQKTGRWLWQYRRDLPAGFTIRGASAPKVSNGIAYIGFSDGALVALKIDDGTVKWERTLSQGTQFIDVDTTPVFDEAGRLFAASFKDGVFALDPKTGETRWQTQRPGITSLVVHGKMLFAGGEDQLAALMTDTGRMLWTLDLPNRASRMPVLAHGFLAVPTVGSLLFVEPATGIVRMSWNPGKGVSATPFVADSRVYVLSNLGYLYALRLKGKGG